jgi:hypothetical protein
VVESLSHSQIPRAAGTSRFEEIGPMALRPQPDEPEQSPANDPSRGLAGREDSTFLAPGARFNVGDLLDRTRSIYKAQWSTCMAVYWGAGAANVMLVLTVDLILSGLNDLTRDPTFYEFLRFLHFLAIWVIPAWLWIGQTLALLKIARGEAVTLEDLFRGRPYLLTTILATVVLLVVAGVPFLLVQGLTSLAMVRYQADPLASLVIGLSESCLSGATAFPTLVQVGQNWLTWLAIGLGGTCLSGIAVFPVLVRLGQFPYAIIDQGVGILRSHLASWRMTRGHVATVFLVYLAYLTINLAGLFAFCAGLFFTLPWTNLLLAVTYDALSEAAGSSA